MMTFDDEQVGGTPDTGPAAPEATPAEVPAAPESDDGDADTSGGVS